MEVNDFSLTKGYSVPENQVEFWTDVDLNDFHTLPDFNLRVLVELKSGLRMYAARFNRVCFVNLLGEPKAFSTMCVRRWKYVPVNGSLRDFKLINQVQKVQK